ncbi:MAG: FAD-dependent monooxygenase [Novosphingobium sp.]|mgnify:CR=1 FL=1|nr:FAD-dependent monooxygenase [Novosphingobium sp.]
MLDVIIVGGGPTGFVNALGLAQAGVSVHLIEAEPDIVKSPRAPVYHWSVLEGLDRLGVLDDCLGIGFKKQDYTYLVKKTGESIAYDLTVLEGRVQHPYNMHLGQHLMAGIVRRHLERFSNATVEFGQRFVGLDQDADGVTAHVEGEGGTRQLRAKWVIGADGAGSAVRKSLGLDFEGFTWPERFIATNLYYDFTQYGYARSTLMIDEEYGAIIAQIDRDGLWRCTYMEDASLPEEGVMERLPSFYSKILPHADDYKVDAVSPYRMHQRSAEKYRVGRVVLAGDAAHSTNPTGGLGLTSGLFDSYALIPALASVILEGADDEVLDRYSDARKDAFVNRASPQAARNKQLIYHANGGGQALAEALEMCRRMRDDKEFCFERLMFTKTLETPPLLSSHAA